MASEITRKSLDVPLGFLSEQLPGRLADRLGWTEDPFDPGMYYAGLSIWVLWDTELTADFVHRLFIINNEKVTSIRLQSTRAVCSESAMMDKMVEFIEEALAEIA